jgi:hypothetical protein
MPRANWSGIGLYQGHLLERGEVPGSGRGRGTARRQLRAGEVLCYQHSLHLAALPQRTDRGSCFTIVAQEDFPWERGNCVVRLQASHNLFSVLEQLPLPPRSGGMEQERGGRETESNSFGSPREAVGPRGKLRAYIWTLTLVWAFSGTLKAMEAWISLSARGEGGAAQCSQVVRHGPAVQLGQAAWTMLLGKSKLPTAKSGPHAY